MFKLALTAGHYLGTAGKRCLKALDPKETKEWVLNDRIADKIEKLLAQYQDVVILRTDDTTGNKDISLANRVKSANNFDADFYLSIHHNAGINGGTGGGIMAYVYNNASSESRKWQTELYDALINSTGLKGNRSNPVAQAAFYEVKYTNMPAVLLELGFMDSKTDVPVILKEEFAAACAEACVNVIVKRAKLVKKVPVTPPHQEITNKATTLRKGSQGEKVKRLQNLLNLLGYECGNADGDFGAKTESAVRAFQSNFKIGVDGIFGETSYKTLKRALTSTNKVYKKGNKNNGVKALQLILNDYKCNCGTPDGIFGNGTLAAVKLRQKACGLAQDGIAGKKTIGSFVDYLQL